MTLILVRHLSANLGSVPADTFSKDQHKDLKADFIMANPPFNQKDWRGTNELLDDPRWAGYDTPPTSNANYAWIQHFLYHLAPTGTAGFVLAKGSLTSNTSNEGELINRRTKEFSHEDTDYIAGVYQTWRNSKEYEDIKGFCKSASLDEVRELNYVLTLGRYVGLEEVDDEFDFKERFASLQTELKEQMKQEQELNQRINENLVRVMYE